MAGGRIASLCTLETTNVRRRGDFSDFAAVSEQIWVFGQRERVDMGNRARFARMGGPPHSEFCGSPFGTTAPKIRIKSPKPQSKKLQVGVVLRYFCWQIGTLKGKGDFATGCFPVHGGHGEDLWACTEERRRHGGSGRKVTGRAGPWRRSYQSLRMPAIDGKCRPSYSIARSSP